MTDAEIRAALDSIRRSVQTCQNAATTASAAADRATAVSSDAARINAQNWKGDWVPGTTYGISDIVGYSNKNYLSLVNSNKNRRPPTSPSFWREFNVTVTTGSSGGGSSSPGDLTSRYWVSETAAPLPNSVNLGALGNGVIQQTASGGVSTPTALEVGLLEVPYGVGSGQLGADITKLNFDPSLLQLGIGTSTITQRGSGATTIEAQGTTVVSMHAVGGVSVLLDTLEIGAQHAEYPVLTWQDGTASSVAFLQLGSSDVLHSVIYRIKFGTYNGDFFWRPSDNVFVLASSNAGIFQPMELQSSAITLTAIAGGAGFVKTDSNGLLSTDTNQYAPITRTFNTNAPLTGGGDFSVNRTLGVSDFVASGASHARGTVPDPGAVAGTSKFLCEDATWAVPAGGSTPSGTGFTHITAGAQDAAAKLVDTADINADQVTYAKIQNVSATDRLLGRDTAGAGDIEELTATGGLEFTGTGIRTSAFTGDVTKAAGGTATTLASAPFAVINTSLGTANADIGVNARKIVNAADPTSAQDVATKAYVDALASGLDPKGNVRALSDSNVAILSGLSTTVDGVALNTDGDRVLLNNQSTGSQTGIWVVHSGAWTRATDMAALSNASGAYCFVEEGTTYANLGFICTNPALSATVSVNTLTFQQFSGAGQINAGAGMTKTGNTLNIGANADGSITVNSDDIQVGILATDAQHGNRGNGALHTAFAASGASHAAGFVPDPGASAGSTRFLCENATWVTPSGVTFTDFTADLGTGRASGTFDITGLSGLITGKNVVVMQTNQAIASKGNSTDESEIDTITLTGRVLSATAIRCNWWASGVVTGIYAFMFCVSG